MAQKNLGLEIAQCAVESISSLNRSPLRSIELYEKIRLAQEENERVAKKQNQKATPPLVSGVAAMAFSLIGQVFKDNNNSLGDIIISIGKTAPEVSRYYSNSLDGSITTHSHTSRTSDVAAQRISQSQSTTENLIGRNVEQISRLLAKEI